MNHIENRMFEEMKQLIDRSTLIWLTFMTVVSLLTGLLFLLGILPRQTGYGTTSTANS